MANAAKRSGQRLDDRLPGPLRRRGVALLLCLLMVLLAVMGLGGIRLRAEQRAVTEIFVSGVESDGYSICYDLKYRAQAADTLVAAGKVRLGAQDGNVQAAEAALTQLRDVLAEAVPGPAAAYQANLALGSKVDAMMQAMGGKNDQELSGVWAEFLSRDQIMSGDGYHEAAQSFNRQRASFPANLIGALWGVPEVERFA